MINQDNSNFGSPDSLDSGINMECNQSLFSLSNSDSKTNLQGMLENDKNLISSKEALHDKIIEKQEMNKIHKPCVNNFDSCCSTLCSDASQRLLLDLEGEKNRKSEPIQQYPEMPPPPPFNLPPFQNGALMFPVKSLGWCEINETDLTPERSSKAVNKCIMDLSYGKNSLETIGKWGEGQNLLLIIDPYNIQLKNIDGKLITVQPIQTIKVWGVGKENGRDFAYVVRDTAGTNHKSGSSILTMNNNNNTSQCFPSRLPTNKLTASATLQNLSSYRAASEPYEAGYGGVTRRSYRTSVPAEPAFNRYSDAGGNNYTNDYNKKQPFNRRFICYVFRCGEPANNALSHNQHQLNPQNQGTVAGVGPSFLNNNQNHYQNDKDLSLNHRLAPNINGTCGYTIANTLKAACKRLMIERSSQPYHCRNHVPEDPYLMVHSQPGFDHNDYHDQYYYISGGLNTAKLNKSISFHTHPTDRSGYGFDDVIDERVDNSVRFKNRPQNLSLSNNRPHISPIISPIDVGFLDPMHCFPTPIEEPYRILKALYIGEIKVDKPSGMDTLNEAINTLSNKVPQSAWTLVRVKISPSSITIHDHNLPLESEPLAKCRVRYLSFLGISKTDPRNCGFIMNGIWAPNLKSTKPLTDKHFSADYTTTQNEKDEDPTDEKENARADLGHENTTVVTADDQNDEFISGDPAKSSSTIRIDGSSDDDQLSREFVAEKFLCQVFRCEPTGAALCKTIEAACRLRYQKCMDSARNREANYFSEIDDPYNGSITPTIPSLKMSSTKNLNIDAINGSVKTLTTTLRSVWNSITWKHPTFTP